MDLIDFLSISGLTVSMFIVYRLLVHERSDKTKGHYTRPAWNFFLKKIYAEYKIKRQRKIDKLRNIHENEKRYEFEAPKILPNEESSDSQFISGNDEEGNSILIKFTRRRHRVAEIWLVLRLSSGDVYAFPEHPNTKIVDATPRIFEGSGLRMECLVPYSKWRITYSGMLRRGIAQDISDDEANFHFVKFNFLWRTACDPIHWPHDWSPKLIATALATEKWRDGKWMNLITRKDAGGYDQFGTCHGEVKIFDNDLSPYVSGFSPKVEKFEFNLPGIRQRRWGPHKSDHLHRTGVIMGSTGSGCAFEVGALSGKYGLTHSQFGNVRFPNGRVVPIDSTDFNLAALGEFQDNLPEATIVQINAGGKKITVVINFKNNAKVPLCGGSQKESWNAFIIPVEIKFNTHDGFGKAIFWYPRNIREFDIQEIPSRIKRIFNRTDLPSPNKPLISFADKVAESVFVSGGKGSSIAILRAIQESNGKHLLDTRARSNQILNALVDQVSTNPLKRSIRVQSLLDNGIPQEARQRSGSVAKSIFPDPHDFDVPEFHVPEGFLISVSAFEQHVKVNANVGKALNDLEGVAYEKVDGDLKNACEKVQAALKSSDLDASLKDLIAENLNRINSDGSSRFAVRSSGITEDSEESSAAGQNETFLGLKNNEDVFEGIKKCWASLFSFQSVQYRKQHVQSVVSAMAVVVQEMVNAESAGVLFSRHPLNGDPAVTVITANYGLGESVVSAKAEPDSFYVKRTYRDQFEFLGSQAGDKKLIIQMDDEASIREVSLSEEQRKRLCLSEDVVLKLAELGAIMEKFFGTPRDLEFAVTRDGKIYLLQSRPITSLHNFTDYEIIHENDTAIMSARDAYTRANVGEVILGSASTLLQTTFRMDKYIFEDFSGGAAYSSLFEFLITYSSQHVFMNMGPMYLVNMNGEPPMIQRIASLGIFGTDVFEKYPELVEIAIERSFYNSSPSMRPFFFMFKTILNLQKFMNNIQELCDKAQAQFSTENIRKLSTASDVWALTERGLDDLGAVLYSHASVSQYSMVFQLIAFAILAGKSKRLTLQHQTDIALILGSMSNVESANVPEMIKEIAGKILLMNKREEFIKVDSKKAVAWLESNCSSVYELFQQFIKRHGHRCINELDFIAKPWSMEPEKVIDMIKSNLNHIGSGGAQPKLLTSDEIVDSLKTPLGSIAKFFIQKILPKCQQGVQKREEAKSMLVFMTNEVRRAITYLGQLMVHEGLLPEKDLIFHCSAREIKELIANRDGKIVAKAIRRQKMFPRLNELKFPEITFGVPRPVSFTEINNGPVSKGDVIARGVPVCGGAITGRACVCKSFADVHMIQKGDILVTFGTDIGWSPYFPILGGVCTEIGGLISHGAVVAREYGLPCIVSASFATHKIKHGQMITLNADDGTICAATGN